MSSAKRDALFLPFQGEGQEGDGVRDEDDQQPPIPTLSLPLKGREL